VPFCSILRPSVQFSTFRSILPFFLSRIPQDHPRKPVDQSDVVKIHHQPQRNIQQFHVTQQLSLVNWKHAFHRLDFNLQTIFDQDVESQGFREHEVFVFDSHFLLLNGMEPSQFKLSHETLFVDAFE